MNKIISKLAEYRTTLLCLTIGVLMFGNAVWMNSSKPKIDPRVTRIALLEKTLDTKLTAKEFFDETRQEELKPVYDEYQNLLTNPKIRQLYDEEKSKPWDYWSFFAGIPLGILPLAFYEDRLRRSEQ